MPCVEGDTGLYSFLIVGELSLAISHDLLFSTPPPPPHPVILLMQRYFKDNAFTAVKKMQSSELGM